MKISEKMVEEMDGQQVIEYCITNKNGASLRAINYGATLTAIEMPDRNGQLANVVLGFTTVKEYIEHKAFFGATVGRVAGRIKDGQFELNGEKYQLILNEGKHHLHGGGHFNQQIWESKSKITKEGGELHFNYFSPTGEKGYPGNLNVSVVFTLTEQNQWKIKYQAETDQATLFDPTNHVYFNLSGQPHSTILDHELTLKSDKIVELQTDLIPTGELTEVKGTAFDLNKGHKLRAGIESRHPQNQLVKGYDHGFVLVNKINEEAAILVDSSSGRRLKMYTDRPAVVVYSGNQLNGEFELNGLPVQRYAGMTLETQGLPDAMNHQGFGSIVLKPGEKYTSETSYTFDIV